VGRSSRGRIPDDVLKEIFPEKLRRSQSSDEAYIQLRKMILSGKLKKREKITYERIVHDFNISRDLAHRIISQLKKDRLVISKRKIGSFVV